MYTPSMRVLFVSDIVGSPGRQIVRDRLADIVAQQKIDLVIANGENSAAGFGITPRLADEFLHDGIDVLTGGNHSWDRREIMDYLPHEPRLLRPANFPDGSPGSELASLSPDIDFVFVDMHAETTSEKVAMGWYLDGRATVVVGTHTHVATADEHVLPQGTAYITDVGMTGPHGGVIGMDRQGIIKKFLDGLPARFEVAEGDIQMNTVLIETADESPRNSAGRLRARSIERVRFRLDT